MIASEIGTSMPSRPRRRLAQAERKNGCPAKITVGMAMAAEIQWNMSRVASSAPDQTATDSSITFIIEKTGDAQPHQQFAPLPVRLGRPTAARRPARAPRSPRRPARRSAPAGVTPGIGIHADPLLRQVHPGRPHARHRCQTRSRRSRCRPRNAPSGKRQHEPRRDPARQAASPLGRGRRRAGRAGRQAGTVECAAARSSSSALHEQVAALLEQRAVRRLRLDLHHPFPRCKRHGAAQTPSVAAQNRRTGRPSPRSAARPARSGRHRRRPARRGR